MSAHWEGDDFRDSFRAEILKLVEKTASAGKVEVVIKEESLPPDFSGSNVVPLTEPLERSVMTPAATTKAVAKKLVCG